MAISFNGSTSKLTWSGTLISAFPITIFAWIKPSSASLSRMVAGTADFGGDDELMMYADGGGTTKLRAFSRKDGGSVAADSASALVTTWQPAMCVFTNTSSRTAYYAGGASGTNTDSNVVVPSTHDRIIIGARGITDTLFFSGDIAEVAFWSTALGSSEWTTLSGGELPENVAEASLVEHWALENATDLTGTVSRTLTATDATTAADHPLSRPGPSMLPPRSVASRYARFFHF